MPETHGSVFHTGLHQVGSYVTGTYRIDPDAEPCQFDSQRSGHSRGCGFGNVIERALGVVDDRVGRRDHDNASLSLLFHVSGCGAGAKIIAADVQGEYFVDLFDRVVGGPVASRAKDEQQGNILVQRMSSQSTIRTR